MKSLFAITLSGMALLACSNDEVPGNSPDDGKAWVGLSLSLPLTTKADPNDANADAVETDIKTVDVYIAGSGILPTVSKIASVNLSSFTAANGNLTMNNAVEVPGGTSPRALYVVINAPAAPAFTPDYFAKDAFYGAIIGKLADATSGFTMFNATAVTADLYATAAEAKTTPTLVDVARAAAKVLVTGSSGGIDPATDFADKNTTGKFSANSLKWLIGNSNKKIYPVPDKNGKDPNWATLTDKTAWATTVAAEYEQLTNPAYNMAVPKYDAAVVTGYEGGTYVQYCNENTNETYQIGNTTYISLTAEFTPGQVVAEGDITALDNIADPATAGSKGATFYYHVGSQKYYNAAAYTKYTGAPLSGAATDFFGPYTAGVCYYYIPIRNGNLATSAMGVTRNKYYTARIKSLVAPGNPTPLTPDPTDPTGPLPKNPDPTIPIDVPLNVAVDITVKAWTPADMGDLEVQ